MTHHKSRTGPITLLCPCDGFHHYSEPIREFEKRLSKQVTLVKLKPSKKRTPQTIVNEETTKVIAALASYTSAMKIVLTPEGKQYSTADFVKLLEKCKMHAGHIVYIAGGSYGLEYDRLRSHIDVELSLGLMTFPHAQAVLILLEQIYRAEMITKGSGYHHS